MIIITIDYLKLNSNRYFGGDFGTNLRNSAYIKYAYLILHRSPKGATGTSHQQTVTKKNGNINYNRVLVYGFRIYMFIQFSYHLRHLRSRVSWNSPAAI